MNEDTQDVAVQQEQEVAVEQKQELDYKSMYEKANADLQAVAKKKDQLLDEKKKVSQNAENTKSSLEQQLNELKESIKNEKVQVNALQLASELAEGHNVKLLAKFLQEDIKNAIETDGALSADRLSEIKEEYAKNEMYKSLLKQSKAAGGGATGNTGNKGVNKEMSRADFDALDQTARRKFFVDGGKLI